MSAIKNKTTTEIIEQLIRKIVEIANPLKIFLFGSAAKDEMNANSDIDLMVVMPDGTHRIKTTQQIYRQLFGFGFPVDIVVTTPSILEKHKDNIGLIYRKILKEGKEVYLA